MVQLSVVALATLVGFGQAAGREGTATGTLTVNGVPATLRYAYASAEPGAFDKSSEDIRILLSDVALSDETRSRTFGVIELARAGSASVVELVIDARGRVISGAIYAKAFNGMVSVTGMHELSLTGVTRTAISGRANVTGSREFMGVTWAYDVTFAAPVPRPPTADELRGMLQSPPALVAERYVDALRRRDFSLFSATLAPDLAGAFRGAEGQARFDELAAEMPPDSRVVLLEPQVDGRVLAKVEGHANGIVIGYTLVVVGDGADWKIGR